MSRYLIVTGIFPPDIGGPATFIPALAAELNSRGHSVTIFSLEDPGAVHPPISGSAVFVNRRIHAPFRQILSIIRLFGLVRKCDRIFANGLFEEVALANLLLRRPVTAKVVGDPIWERAVGRGRTSLRIQDFQASTLNPSLRIQRQILKLSLSSFQKIVSPSLDLLEYAERWGVRIPKEYIPNGVVIGPPLNKEKRRDVIAVSRLVPWKRLDLLVQICGLAGASLCIVGEGSESSYIRERAAEVHCQLDMQGVASPEQIQVLLAESRVYALISSYEGMAFSLLEAKAAGLPCVVSNIVPNEVVVRHGVDGIVLDPNDTVVAASALRSLLDDKEKMSEYSLEARLDAESRFSLTTTLDRTISAI